jgi:hypothetical protein
MDQFSDTELVTDIVHAYRDVEKYFVYSRQDLPTQAEIEMLRDIVRHAKARLEDPRPNKFGGILENWIGKAENLLETVV